jgi:replicative DNA helicase
MKQSFKEYINHGLSVLPLMGANAMGKDFKAPALYSWESLQATALSTDEVDTLFRSEAIRLEIKKAVTKKSGDTFTSEGIKAFIKPKALGIITGEVSGNLEVLDIDTKNDHTGSLWGDFKTLIEGFLPEVSQRLVIARTMSGGYHIYYKCSAIGGNAKLAVNKEKKVIIETRGEGGYVVAPPSAGYKFIQGDAANIPTLTPEDRDRLFNMAQSFNEVETPKTPQKTTGPTPFEDFNENPQKTTRLTPFEDFNANGDVVKLLEDKGWKVVSQQGARINLLRPGQPDSKTSGNFHEGFRTLRIFSTSTEFDPDKTYSPTDVFLLLECDNNTSIASRRLLEMGYGEPYPGDNNIAPTQVKTDLIKIETVNEETSIIASPGETLKIENIPLGVEVVITSPGYKATEEVLKFLELMAEVTNKVYVIEGGVEVKAYRYRLEALLKKYGALQEHQGGLTDRLIDSFMEEIVETSAKLQPLERDVFIKEFISQAAIKELGITEESLSITADKLASTKATKAQGEDLEKLLSDATKLHAKGETKKALELMDSKAKEVKLRAKETEFSSLMKPTTEAELKERQATKPESLNSGYKIGGQELLLPSGAISIFAAPTSHGKTTWLINMALNVAQDYKDKEVYLFSYEEDGDSILINTLNTYIDRQLSLNPKKSIKDYFADSSNFFVESSGRDYFHTTKDKFFSELIASKRLNINYTDYSTETLIEAIRYLHKHANVGAVFIDYIQLLRKKEGRWNLRNEELKQVCLDFKDLAVETRLPIILGAQFNRDVVNHLVIHPTKISEAGDIERQANLVVGFWNNTFTPIGKPGELNEISKKNIDASGTIYCKILKNRGGAAGKDGLLDFNGDRGKIKNRKDHLLKL